jgi:hypothetical protein
LFVACALVSGVQAQPAPVVDLPPPAIVTPRYVPASKGSAIALPVVPPPVAMPSVPVVPAFGTDAPVMPRPVALQPELLAEPKVKPRLPDAEGLDTPIDSYARRELPGPQLLFRRDSEREFFERIAQDMKRTPGNMGKPIFPQEPIISKEAFQIRVFPRMVREIEPCYVCHRRLYFEQPNFERTGYDFGVLTPAMCVGAFYYDLVLLPYHF